MRNLANTVARSTSAWSIALSQTEILLLQRSQTKKVSAVSVATRIASGGASLLLDRARLRDRGTSLGLKKPSMLCWPVSAVSMPVNASCTAVTFKSFVFPVSSFHSLSAAFAITSTVISWVKGNADCLDLEASYPVSC